MTCDCCTTAALGEVFGERHSRRDARRFRRKGLERRARRLLDALAAAAPLGGATSLEIGAGIGGLSITLLERGAARADAVDASPAAAMVARELAEEAGVADRFSMQVGDFAALGIEERYDVVILDRVVCCYPGWRELLGPAAAAARRALAMSYPREAWYNRAFRRLLNGAMALLRMDFRFYIHSPAAMHGLLREQGLEARVVGREGPWELVVAKREG